MSAITYYRGDQYPILLTVKNAATGLPLDITGFSFLLTVNTESKPTDATNQVFQKSGTLDADPTTGKVSFPILSADTAIEPKTYYYDIQMTTLGGDVRTIVKSTFRISMDITK